jgi:hypothetical protein
MYPTKNVESDFIRRFKSDSDFAASVMADSNFLEASQYELIQLMVKNNIWQGAVPLDPGGTGEIEFSLVPYWLANPPAFIRDILDMNIFLQDIWNTLSNMAPNQISGANYQALLSAATKQGIVADDGTIFGESTYEQMDWLWITSLMNYLLVKYDTNKRAPFNMTPAAAIQLSGAVQGQVKIALVGDWGTGQYPTGPAQIIIDQITALKPDYIIHLGDVYYAGTPDLSFSQFPLEFLPPKQEQDNFLDVWPDATVQAPGTSFMLNSNHEMYSGANGYYFALNDPRFAAQQNTSYFALQFGGWTLLGLDSAFFDTSQMFMEGSIGGTQDSTQNDWVQGLNLSADKTIVMTHHTGLSASGATENTLLCNEINTALGGKDPAAWYWGHIHNGIVYNSPTVTGRQTLSRCVGHGAIPFADGFGVPGPHVSYYAHTPNTALPNSIRVLNGFAMLTIESGGTVTEEFFEQGNETAVYSNTYS